MSTQMLENTEELEDIFKVPKALVFKHSTRCGISRFAYAEVMKYLESCRADICLFIVDVIKNKHISKEIQKKTGITHESPQVLLIKSGAVIWHDSHWNITEQNLKKAIENL